MALTITREKSEAVRRITEELDQIVAEFGYDYVYPHARLDETGIGRCMYVENKDPQEYDTVHNADIEDLKPSCIIGQLAVRLGVELEALISVNDEAYSEAANHIYIPHANYVHRELTILQERQDKGMRWGEAVDKFKQETFQGEAA